MENSGISHLSLARNKLGDNGVRELGVAIGCLKNMVYLDLSNNSLTYRGAEFLLKGIKDNHSLIDINLASKSGPFKNILGVKGA